MQILDMLWPVLRYAIALGILLSAMGSACRDGKPKTETKRERKEALEAYDAEYERIP